MPNSIEPYWLLGAVFLAALVLHVLVTLFRRHRLSARQKAYRAYLQTPVWRQLRREAIERDGRRCRLCNANQDLQVHHRYYPEILGTETVDALTTLCHRCHETVAHHADR